MKEIIILLVQYYIYQLDYEEMLKNYELAAEMDSLPKFTVENKSDLPYSLSQKNKPTAINTNQI